jgi:hypothetical protein
MADSVTTLQKQIEKKRSEIASREKQLDAERSFLLGLEAALKTISKTSLSTDLQVSEKKPRAGSEIAQCLDVLKLSGKPMHVDALLAAIGKEVNKANRVSLSGSLAGYACDGKWFIRAATPNTFGLIGMELESKDQDAASERPVM